jgi:hypothetical protein
MRATVMYRAGDVRIENVPDARLIEPTDALITIWKAGSNPGASLTVSSPLMLCPTVTEP